MKRLFMTILVGCATISPAVQASSSNEDKKPAAAQATKAGEVVPAAEAHKHIDKKVTVEMTVKSAKNVESRKVFFLDSEEDYKAPANVALVIPYAAAEDFKKAGIDDVIAHYMNKKIRVTGTLIHQSEQTRLIVTDVKQIEAVK